MSKNNIFNILKKRYPGNAFALMKEVSDKAGFARSRSADYIAVGLYPSRGLHVEGIELKSHRGDWLNELKNPKKAENIFQHCDYFWLLTKDETVAKPEEIPSTWGWLCVKGEKIFVKKAAPKLTPIPLTKHFLASMLKRACDKTDYVHIDSIQERIDLEKDNARSTSDRAITNLAAELKELRESVNEFQNASGINLSQFKRWNHFTAKQMGEAVRFIEGGGDEAIKQQLFRLEEVSKEINFRISNGISIFKSEK